MQQFIFKALIFPRNRIPVYEQKKQNQTFSFFQDINLDILFSCSLNVFLLSHFFGSFLLFTSSSWALNLRLQYHSKNV